MSTEEHKALLARVRDEVWGQGRLDSLEEFLQDAVIAHEPDGDVRGVEEFRQYLSVYLTAFPDTSVTVEDVIAEGDKAVVRYTDHGTHTGTTDEFGPPTGKQITFQGMTLYHFKDGKVAELWDLYDTLALMQQLGLMPEAEAPTPG